jgi:hypothetical protein
MSHTDTQLQPVPVHITNPEAIAGAAKASPRKHVRAVYRTFALTGGIPLPILAEDLSRFDTWLVAYNNSVIICESQSQAQDPDNAVAGTGQFTATPANPQGTLLYANAGGSPAVMTSTRWTLDTTEVVWAVSLASAYLAVTTHNKVTGY